MLVCVILTHAAPISLPFPNPISWQRRLCLLYHGPIRCCAEAIKRERSKEAVADYKRCDLAFDRQYNNRYTDSI